MKGMLKGLFVKPLAWMGFTITRRNKTCEKNLCNVYSYAKETIAAADSQGVSVCDYVENLWGKRGDTQRVIDQMISCGVFQEENPCILEIGAGTGRYLEKMFQNCQPAKYESYETASEWAEWLQGKYAVVSQPADGVSLKQTSSLSIDILHAHGVFTYVPFLVSYRYWLEIWRVVKKDGWVVFDIISENCLDEQIVGKWLQTEHKYPCFVSKDYIVSLFARHGFALQRAFMNRYDVGQSEYLVFARHTAPEGKGNS